MFTKNKSLLDILSLFSRLFDALCCVASQVLPDHLFPHNCHVRFEFRRKIGKFVIARTGRPLIKSMLSVDRAISIYNLW